jgi:hypothetical protein
LQYLRARWYDPAAGTFLGRDPFEGFDTMPYSLHPYQYGDSDPVRFTDPSGKYRVDLQRSMLVLTDPDEAYDLDAGLDAPIEELEEQRSEERVKFGTAFGVFVGSCAAVVTIATAGTGSPLLIGGATLISGGAAGGAATATGLLDDLGVDPNETVITLNALGELQDELSNYRFIWNTEVVGELRIWMDGWVINWDHPGCQRSVLCNKWHRIHDDAQRAEDALRNLEFNSSRVSGSDIWLYIERVRTTGALPLEGSPLGGIPDVKVEPVGWSFFLKWRETLRWFDSVDSSSP